MDKIEGARWKTGLGERLKVGIGLLATTFWKFSSSISLGEEIGEGRLWRIGLSIYQYPSKDNTDQRRRRRTFPQEQWFCYISL